MNLTVTEVQTKLTSPRGFDVSLQSMTKFWMRLHNLLRLRQVPDAWVEMRPPDLGAAVVEIGLQATAPQWLFLNTVAEYLPSDYEFLGAEDCRRLSTFVDDFRVAVAQPDGGPRARAALLGVLALFEFDRYYDPIAFQVGKRVEALIRDAGWPDYLTRLKFATIADHNGNPAMGIWAFLADGEDAEALARMRVVRPLLEEATRQAAPDRWPYIHFRTESEQAELEREREQLQRQEAA